MTLLDLERETVIKVKYYERENLKLRVKPTNVDLRWENRVRRQSSRTETQEQYNLDTRIIQQDIEFRYRSLKKTKNR